MSDDAVRLRAEAGVLRKLYYDKRKVLGRGGKVQPRSDNMKDWERAALLVRELGADPADFIDAAFHYCALSTGPFANGLGGKQAASWYRQWASLKATPDMTASGNDSPSLKDLRQRIDYTRAILIHRHKTMDISEEVIQSILDTTLQLDPLSCVILGGHDPRVRDMYLEEALSVVTENFGLRKVLEDLGVDLHELR